jgi:RHH-type transcriptional regulator, rel operon repressor / antitoxin RelB
MYYLLYYKINIQSQSEKSMLTIRLPENLEYRLITLAAQTGRPKSYYIRHALQTFLDEEEDYLLAINRLEKNNPKIALDDLEKQLGLES